MGEFKEEKEKNFYKLLSLIDDKDFKEWALRNKNALICRPKSIRDSYLDALEEEDLSTFNVPLFFRGEVYFANLSPNKSAKIRPVVILQNNYLNRAVYYHLYQNILIAPLTSRVYGGDYRVLIKKRDNLIKDSEVVLNAIGIILAQRVLFNRGVVTKLNKEELQEIKEKLNNLLS
ncbi:MAG: type II toxin-antitoxin system PemK/MazF family toxin [Epsilonproteobacteria bacterium]|nr:type II toxin-antitoxin system PemK/MazF family toxin [Campylobacterota bacterium]